MAHHYRSCEEPSPTSDPVLSAFTAINTSPETIEHYLPELQSLQAVLRLDPAIAKAWLYSFYIKLKKNLIDNDTFILGETPAKCELVVPTKTVNKAKQTASGELDNKPKTRIVACGDYHQKCHIKKNARLYKDAQKLQNQMALEKGLTPSTAIVLPQPQDNTWSPTASSRGGVNMFLAICAASARAPKGANYIGAYLQAKMIGRHFIKVPKEYAEYFPEYAKYFGVPVLLNKGIYSMVFSGKLWHIEYTEWLFSQGFIQSPTDPSNFVKCFKQGQWLHLIFL
jgi:hypothetical protein